MQYKIIFINEENYDEGISFNVVGDFNVAITVNLREMVLFSLKRNIFQRSLKNFVIIVLGDA